MLKDEEILQNVPKRDRFHEMGRRYMQKKAQVNLFGTFNGKFGLTAIAISC